MMLHAHDEHRWFIGDDGTITMGTMPRLRHLGLMAWVGIGRLSSLWASLARPRPDLENKKVDRGILLFDSCFLSFLFFVLFLLSSKLHVKCKSQLSRQTSQTLAPHSFQSLSYQLPPCPQLFTTVKTA